MEAVLTWAAVIVVLGAVFLVDWEGLGKKLSQRAINERVIFEIRPMFPVRSVVVAALSFMAMLVLFGGTLRSLLSPSSIDLMLFVAVFPVGLVFVVSFTSGMYQIFLWLVIRYKLTTCRVAIVARHLGFERSIPLGSIQMVDLIGKSVGTIVIRSALLGGYVTMANVNNPAKYHDAIVNAISNK